MRRGMTKEGGIQLQGAVMGMQDEYSEKPRPNLYNVIKKIRESGNPTLHRLCYLSKIDEKKFKGDFEKDFNNWFNHVVNNQDEDEIPLEEDETLQYGGFAIVLGPWCVHMIEAEQILMQRFVKHL